MKKLFLLSTCLATLASSYGQRYMGVAGDNYGGMNSLYLNPANIADSRQLLVVDIASLNVAIDNNLGKLSQIGTINKFISGNNTSVNDVFQYSNRSKFSLQAPYGEVRLPGLMFSINHKHSVALTARVRGFNQFNNFDKSLYRTITDTSYSASGNVDLTANKFNWTAQLWTEIAATWGGVVYEKGRHQFKVGATVRYLGGAGYVGLKGNNLDAHYSNAKDSFYARNTDLEYASNFLSTRSALTSGVGNNDIISRFFDTKSGKGVGGDLGFVYTYLEDTVYEHYEMDGKTDRIDDVKNRYKFRLSASVTDIGYMKYPTENNYTLNVSGDGGIKGSDLVHNVSNYTDFKDYVLKNGFKVDTGRAKVRVFMPTTLILSGDYHIQKYWYVNATFIGNVANRQNFGNSYYGQFTITPRYEKKLYSIGLPVTYSALAENIKVGLGGRYKGFFIGSDDMMVLFTNHQYGLNFYMGGFVAVNKFRPKDRDKDHVSDRKDRCPDDYGDWAHRGCPSGDKEKDKEKVNTSDSLDECPEVHGLAPAKTSENLRKSGSGQQSQHSSSLELWNEKQLYKKID